MLTTRGANVKSHKSCITKGVLQPTAAVLQNPEERGGRGLSGSLNEWREATWSSEGLGERVCLGRFVRS